MSQETTHEATTGRKAEPDFVLLWRQDLKALRLDGSAAALLKIGRAHV